MSKILDSLQEINDAAKKKQRIEEQAYSDIYAPAMRKNRKNLRKIIKRLEHSREIIINISKKMNSRSSQFHFYLKDIPEFQWFSMQNQSWFIEDDLKIGNIIESTSLFRSRLQMRVRNNHHQIGEAYPIHPVFYTGSIRDIAKFARKIFYRENIRNLQICTNTIENAQHSRSIMPAYDSRGIRFGFDKEFKNINNMNIDDAEMMYHQTLISQMKKYTAKIEQDFEEKNQLRAKMRDADAEKSDAKSKEKCQGRDC